jgi:cyclic pyranopterin phosphate synthase
MGVRTVRLTGGEPLLRKGLPGLVERLAALDLSLSLTTNGSGLERSGAGAARRGAAPGQRQPGHAAPRALPRADPPRPLRRRGQGPGGREGGRSRPGEGQHRAHARASTTTRPGDLLAWALDEGYALRFIEQMPLDPQHGWDRTTMLDADEILAGWGSAGRSPRSRCGAAPRRSSSWSTAARHRRGRRFR